MNIYLVMGTTGEYSDSVDWPVMAYFTEKKAQEHVLNADHKAKELYGMYPRHEEHRIPKGANEFDPQMQTDYSGTSYFIYNAPIGDKPEEKK